MLLMLFSSEERSTGARKKKVMLSSSEKRSIGARKKKVLRESY